MGKCAIFAVEKTNKQKQFAQLKTQARRT
jgi:hypothetical protein